MGNQIAIKLHTTHGQEVICEERGHVFNYEMAMMAHFSGVLARTVAAADGILTWALVQPKLRGKSYHSAKTGLVSLENTHNMAGGTVTPPEVFDEVCDRVHDAGLPVHLDGARVFNASVALGIPVDKLTAKADTVMFCLSKGLGAPVGSMLVGRAEQIDRGRIYRKALGGGMRQAGILAAAGLIALEQGPAKLATDHANAKFLAEGLAKIAGFKIDPTKVQTNILICDISGTGMTSAELSKKCASAVCWLMGWVRRRFGLLRIWMCRVSNVPGRWRSWRACAAPWRRRREASWRTAQKQVLRCAQDDSWNLIPGERQPCKSKFAAV